MSLDLNNYFKLGLDSTNDAVNEPGIMNTIRTPTDTASTQLNRITFKVPKIGMLTGDSHVNVQFLTGVAHAQGRCTPNFVNGALGCVKRFRILMDNKVLTDLENPGKYTTPNLYSRKTPTQLADYHYHYLGNQFKTDVREDNGTEEFSRESRYMITTNNGSQYIYNYNIIGATQATSDVYGIPLRMLGAKFLETNSLPVFLMNDREIVVEITFHSDCREYAISDTATLAAGDVTLNLPRCELVSTHIMLDDETENRERAASMTKAVQFPLLDTYMIRANHTGLAAAGAAGALNYQNSIYRLHLNNRELHSLLMVPVNTPSNAGFPPFNGQSRIVANQRSDCLGDISLQIKSNGQNVFDRPITNPAVLFQLLSYYNQGLALKVPYNAWNSTSQSLYSLQSTDARYLDYRGAWRYMGIDFRNGNSGIFGAGTPQKSALEIDHSASVPNGHAAAPTIASTTKDVFFYVNVSKLLSLGGKNISVSF